MKCQPVRCWPLRNGLKRPASWNWLNVSETLMMSVSLRATSAGLVLAAWAGAGVGFASAAAGFGSAGLAASAGLVAAGCAAAGALVAAGAAGAAPAGFSVGFGGTGTSWDWQATASDAMAPAT